MIRIFIGADGNNCDLESQAVVEWSIRKYASEDVAITWMQNGVGPWAGWKTGSGRTPFTHYRWSIPDVCGYQGRAIYCDSDFMFRADVAELWGQPIPGVALVRRASGKLTTSCILFDCHRAKDHVPDVKRLREMKDAHAGVLGYFRINCARLLSEFEGDWDCIDAKGYADVDDPRIKAIHYSRIETQLHLKHALQRLKWEGRTHWYEGATGPHWRPELQEMFDRLLMEAIAAGYHPERYRIESAGPAARKPFVYQTSRVEP